LIIYSQDLGLQMTYFAVNKPSLLKWPGQQKFFVMHRTAH